MILIQIILVLAFLLLILGFLKRQGSHQLSALAKIFMMLFAAAAIFVILFPDSSNSVAHFVGVGRGADLLLYLLTMSFIFVVLSSYLARKQDQRRFAMLARQVALLEAKIRNKADDTKTTGQ